MNTSLHLQANNTKLHRMGTLLVPILVVLIYFIFSHFLLPWIGVSLVDFNQFIQELGTIKWGTFSFYPAAIFFTLMEEIVILTVIFTILYKNEKIRPKDIGLVWSVGQGGFKQVLNLNAKIILYLFLLSIVGLNLTQYFWGPETIKGAIYLLHNWQKGKAEIGITASLFEEILFRGIYCTLFIRYGFKWRNTILLTGIGFGLFHLVNYQSHVLGYVIEVGFATVVGWFLGWIFYKTRTLMMPILWHYAVNGFICFAVLRPDLLKKFADFVIV